VAEINLRNVSLALGVRLSAAFRGIIFCLDLDVKFKVWIVRGVFVVDGGIIMVH
jgi:hypothetical protein